MVFHIKLDAEKEHGEKKVSPKERERHCQNKVDYFCYGWLQLQHQHDTRQQQQLQHILWYLVITAFDLDLIACVCIQLVHCVDGANGKQYNLE